MRKVQLAAQSGWASGVLIPGAGVALRGPGSWCGGLSLFAMPPGWLQGLKMLPSRVALPRHHTMGGDVKIDPWCLQFQEVVLCSGSDCPRVPFSKKMWEGLKPECWGRVRLVMRRHFLREVFLGGGTALSSGHLLSLGGV